MNTVPVVTTRQVTIADRHDNTGQPTIINVNINDRNRLGISDLSAVNLNERLMQERAAHNRLVQERVLQERIIQERALQERILQERALQDRSMQERVTTLHGPLIIPTSHVITTHERVIVEKAVTPTSVGMQSQQSQQQQQQPQHQQHNIASPGPI